MSNFKSSVQEDVFFYIDLSKEHIKIKNIIKIIEDYIEEKNKINMLGHFGVLIFQEEGNPIFITGQKVAEEIVSAIEDNWKDRAREQSYFENGLFYIFSHIAETVRKKSKFNRVIVLSDTPSDLSEEYQEALFNLVAKIKYFPTFIDIIRITEEDQRFFKDDVKLNILASDTKGGIFYVSDRKELKNIFKKLVKNKQLVDTFTDQPDQLEVDKETYLYYDHLAKNLIHRHGSQKQCYFCQERLCPICMDKNDVPLECPDCGQAYHIHCAVNYTINHNIGIPHVWRCPECDTLLKVSESEFIGVDEEEGENISVQDYLSMENEGLKPEQPIYNESEDFSIPEKVSNDEPVIKSVEDVKIEEVQPPEKLIFTSNQDKKRKDDSIGDPSAVSDEINAQETKRVRIGGFFGKVYSVKKVGDKIVYDKSTSTNSSVNPNSEKNQDLISVQDVSLRKNNGKTSDYWKPPSDLTRDEEDEDKSRVQICPVCGKLLGSGVNKFCPHCGSELKETY
ncbi:MAG: hypothetical protein EU548_07620 [Promethearchaeota archaeon]|nr:MAG: hypothetical protein EU548_07620 [Candidatus Lokiarchaeota archaeon]